MTAGKSDFFYGFIFGVYQVFTRIIYLLNFLFAADPQFEWDFTLDAVAMCEVVIIIIKLMQVSFNAPGVAFEVTIGYCRTWRLIYVEG